MRPLVLPILDLSPRLAIPFCFLLQYWRWSRHPQDSEYSTDLLKARIVLKQQLDSCVTHGWEWRSKTWCSDGLLLPYMADQ